MNATSYALLLFVVLIPHSPCLAAEVLPREDAAISRKVEELCTEAEADRGDFRTRRQALRKFQEALSLSPASSLLFEIHEKIFASVKEMPPTDEAKRVARSSDKKLILASGGLRALEASGATAIRAECDEVIGRGKGNSPAVLAAMIVKGYSYLNDGSEPPNPESIAKSKAIFEEVVARGAPVWILNGLIGLAQAQGLVAVYQSGAPCAEEKEKIYRKIVEEFPDTIFAAMAQESIVGAYVERGKPERALREAEKLLEYKDFTITRFGEPWRFSDLGFRKGVNKLHDDAKRHIKYRKQAIQEKAKSQKNENKGKSQK